jgi:TfoX/Sxy family transcriptional regulator of competence genes
MPQASLLLERVGRLLAQEPDVEQKKMFGSVAFMVRRRMCVCVGKGRIMCRIDPALFERACKRPGVRAVVMKGRVYRGYVHVDAAVLQTAGALKYWVDLALKQNASLAAERPARF